MIFSIYCDDGEQTIVQDPDESAGVCGADGQISKTWKEMLSDGDVTVTDEKLTSVSNNVSGNIVIPTYVTSIGNAAFYNVMNTISVVIPDSVTEIETNAFVNPYGFIADVTIPDSVNYIDINAFANVKHITYSRATDDNTYGACSVNGYKDGDFYYSNDAKTRLIAYVGTDESVSIPDTVQTISKYAFKFCRNTTSITIPSSVTIIGQQAFSQCGIESLTVPNSVTLIGEAAFYNVPNIVYNGSATGSPWGAKEIN